MAHQRLPDEVLKEIITPLLEVPNTLFNNVDVVSPFSKVEWPSSSVLLVCTRWLRIATPACYGVAVIRSEAQACAFNAALTRNPEFARHIKRFRIEGTYPRFITPAIIDLLTGVRELCINIGLLATQSPRDIINLVNKLNPQSLVLFNSVDRKGVNSSQRAIIRTIAGRLPSWNRLTHFTSTQSLWLKFEGELASSIASCSSLRNVRLEFRLPVLARSEYLKLISSNPNVELLFVENQSSGISGHRDGRHWLWQSPVIPTWSITSTNPTIRDALLNDRVHLLQADGTPLASTSVPTFATPLQFLGSANLALTSPPRATRPMDSVSGEIRIAIWAHVLSFVLHQGRNPHAPVIPEGSRIWTFSSGQSTRAVVRVARTCREFQTAANRALMNHLIIDSHAAFDALRHSTTRDPTLLAFASTLLVNITPFHENSGTTLVPFISSLNNLTHVQCIGFWAPFKGIPLGFFSHVPTSHLRRLSVNIDLPKLSTRAARAVSVDSAAFFGSMRLLEELEWDVSELACSRLPETVNPIGFLPVLRKLKIGRAHESLADVLCSTALMNLKEVDLAQCPFSARLLQVHGFKIARWTFLKTTTKAEVDGLTQLVELVVDHKVEASSVTAVSFPSLQRLILKWRSSGPSGSVFYSKVFADIERHAANFPSLVEIHLTHPDEIWPVDERQEKKSIWPELSAQMDAIGVSVRNYHGRAWRQRLVLLGRTTVRR